MKWIFGCVAFFYATLSFGVPFGNPGRDGKDGHHGFWGRNGTNISVVADGKEQSISSPGEDAYSAGEGGSNGSWATNCILYAQPDYNLEGAWGGDGGRGGSGGYGGDGGDVTIFYDKIEDLRPLQVYVPGGLPSAEGRGGRGESGCRCPWSYWTKKHCRDVTIPGRPPQRHCEIRSFTCTDGRDGRDGKSGDIGYRGRNGHLILVPKLRSLPIVNAHAELGLVELASKPVTLTAHRWSSHEAANTIVASGSQVSDTYSLFEGIFSQTQKLVWQASRNIEDFRKVRAQIHVVGNFPNEDLSLILSPFWHTSKLVSKDGVKIYTVMEAVRKEDAEQISFVGIQNNREDTQLLLRDSIENQSLFKTTFHLKLERKFVGYKTIFEGSLDPDLVSQTKDEVALNIGRLNVRSKYFKPGKGLRLTLSAERQWKSFSTTVFLAERKEIRVPY